MENQDRSTLIVLAKDTINKIGFIFNTSTELREPSNKYKKLIEFFELQYDNICKLETGTEYRLKEFSYTIIKELPYSNYNKEDQKEINKVKKLYIDNYLDEQYTLSNIVLNDNTRRDPETKHINNINKLLKENNYKFLKNRFDHLSKLIDYQIVKSYLSDSANRITSDITNTEVSKRYLKEDDNYAGIEILLRKLEEKLFTKLSEKSHILNYEGLIKAYRFATRLEKLENAEDFDAFLLAWNIYNNYRHDRTPVLKMLIDLSKENIKKIFENNDNSIMDEIISNEYFSSILYYSNEWFMDAYIHEDPSNKDLKESYLYILYKRLTNY